MDNIRLILLTALCLVGLLIWQAWQKDYGTVKAPGAASTQPSPDNPDKERSDVPAAPTPAATPPVTCSRMRPVVRPVDPGRTACRCRHQQARGGLKSQLPTYRGGDSPNQPSALQIPPDAFRRYCGFAATNRPRSTTRCTRRRRANFAERSEDQLRSRYGGLSEGLQVSKVYLPPRHLPGPLRYEIKNEGKEAGPGGCMRSFKEIPPRTAAAVYTLLCRDLEPRKRYERSSTRIWWSVRSTETSPAAGRPSYNTISWRP